jgi:hydroxyacylglutathione hydrolase
MLFRQITDGRLAQYAYLIGCQQTKEAIIVDPERDVDRYLAVAHAEGLQLVAAAETHIHADFLSGARELATAIPAIKTYLSDEGDAAWKYEWARRGAYNVQFVHHDDVFRVGNIEFRVLHTPGHTPEHISFLVTDRGAGADEPLGLLSGDFVFVGDLGRPDLLETAAGIAGAMAPAARRLYGSISSFLALPDFVQVWPAHGAGSACGKALGAIPTSTVGYERRWSPAIAASRDGEEPFMDFILAGQPEPPLYFARMKSLNKEGAPVLGSLPKPERLDTATLSALSSRRDVTVVDTRLDRQAFFAAHLPGSLYAPLDKTFPTITGSFIDPDQVIHLLVDDNQVEEAVRALVRIGLDRVAGHASPATLDALARSGVPLARTESIDFAEVERRISKNGLTVLDVRGRTEFDAGHFPDALHIPHTRLRARLGELPRDRPLLVHCGSGARAAASASLLEREGYRATHVDDLFAPWWSAQAQR